MPLYNQLSVGGKLLYSHFFEGVILQYSNFSIGCVWKMARGKWHYTTRVLNNIKVLRLNQFLLKTHFSHQKKKELPVIEFFQYVSTVIVSIRHNYLQNWSVHFLTIFFYRYDVNVQNRADIYSKFDTFRNMMIVLLIIFKSYSRQPIFSRLDRCDRATSLCHDRANFFLITCMVQCFCNRIFLFKL